MKYISVLIGVIFFSLVIMTGTGVADTPDEPSMDELNLSVSPVDNSESDGTIRMNITVDGTYDTGDYPWVVPVSLRVSANGESQVQQVNLYPSGSPTFTTDYTAHTPALVTFEDAGTHTITVTGNVAGTSITAQESVDVSLTSGSTATSIRTLTPIQETAVTEKPQKVTSVKTYRSSTSATNYLESASIPIGEDSTATVDRFADIRQLDGEFGLFSFTGRNPVIGTSVSSLPTNPSQSLVITYIPGGPDMRVSPVLNENTQIDSSTTYTIPTDPASSEYCQDIPGQGASCVFRLSPTEVQSINNANELILKHETTGQGTVGLLCEEVISGSLIQDMNVCGLSQSTNINTNYIDTYSATDDITTAYAGETLYVNSLKTPVDVQATFSQYGNTSTTTWTLTNSQGTVLNTGETDLTAGESITETLLTDYTLDSQNTEDLKLSYGDFDQSITVTYEPTSDGRPPSVDTGGPYRSSVDITGYTANPVASDTTHEGTTIRVSDLSTTDTDEFSRTDKAKICDAVSRSDSPLTPADIGCSNGLVDVNDITETSAIATTVETQEATTSPGDEWVQSDTQLGTTQTGMETTWFFCDYDMNTQETECTNKQGFSVKTPYETKTIGDQLSVLIKEGNNPNEILQYNTTSTTWKQQSVVRKTNITRSETPIRTNVSQPWKEGPGWVATGELTDNNIPLWNVYEIQQVDVYEWTTEIDKTLYKYERPEHEQTYEYIRYSHLTELTFNTGTPTTTVYDIRPEYTPRSDLSLNADGTTNDESILDREIWTFDRSPQNPIYNGPFVYSSNPELKPSDLNPPTELSIDPTQQGNGILTLETTTGAQGTCPYKVNYDPQNTNIHETLNKPLPEDTTGTTRPTITAQIDKPTDIYTENINIKLTLQGNITTPWKLTIASTEIGTPTGTYTEEIWTNNEIHNGNETITHNINLGSDQYDISFQGTNTKTIPLTITLQQETPQTQDCEPISLQGELPAPVYYVPHDQTTEITKLNPDNYRTISRSPPTTTPPTTLTINPDGTTTTDGTTKTWLRFDSDKDGVTNVVDICPYVPQWKPNPNESLCSAQLPDPITTLDWTEQNTNNTTIQSIYDTPGLATTITSTNTNTLETTLDNTRLATTRIPITQTTSEWSTRLALENTNTLPQSQQVTTEHPIGTVPTAYLTDVPTNYTSNKIQNLPLSRYTVASDNTQMAEDVIITDRALSLGNTKNTVPTSNDTLLFTNNIPDNQISQFSFNHIQQTDGEIYLDYIQNQSIVGTSGFVGTTIPNDKRNTNDAEIQFTLSVDESTGILGGITQWAGQLTDTIIQSVQNSLETVLGVNWFNNNPENTRLLTEYNQVYSTSGTLRTPADDNTQELGSHNSAIKFDDPDNKRIIKLDTELPTNQPDTIDKLNTNTETIDYGTIEFDGKEYPPLDKEHKTTPFSVSFDARMTTCKDLNNNAVWYNIGSSNGNMFTLIGEDPSDTLHRVEPTTNGTQPALRVYVPVSPYASVSNEVYTLTENGWEKRDIYGDVAPEPFPRNGNGRLLIPYVIDIPTESDDIDACEYFKQWHNYEITIDSSRIQVSSDNNEPNHKDISVDGIIPTGVEGGEFDCTLGFCRPDSADLSKGTFKPPYVYINTTGMERFTLGAVEKDSSKWYDSIDPISGIITSTAVEKHSQSTIIDNFEVYNREAEGFYDTEVDLTRDGGYNYDDNGLLTSGTITSWEQNMSAANKTNLSVRFHGSVPTRTAVKISIYPTNNPNNDAKIHIHSNKNGFPIDDEYNEVYRTNTLSSDAKPTDIRLQDINSQFPETISNNTSITVDVELLSDSLSYSPRVENIELVKINAKKYTGPTTSTDNLTTNP